MAIDRCIVLADRVCNCRGQTLPDAGVVVEGDHVMTIDATWRRISQSGTVDGRVRLTTLGDSVHQMRD